MVMQVSKGGRANLARQGFGVDFTGFNEVRLPLIAHKTTNLWTRGTVALRIRIGNPGAYNEAEANQLARHAANGAFPWEPGEACLKRTFKDYKVTADALYGSRNEVTETYQGCKWCREEAKVKTESREDVELSVEIESSAQSPVLPVAAISCSVCGFAPLTTNKNGQLQSEKRLRHMLTLHEKKHEATTE